MTVFTEEAVTQALEEILVEYGEDHYYEAQDRSEDSLQSCFYTLPRNSDETEYKPACIIGVLIDKLAPEALQAMGRYEETTLRSKSVYSLAQGTISGVNLGEVPPTVTSALSAAQRRQDGNDSWGEAVDSYKSVLGSY